jgi:hypothetical protein
MQLEQEKVAGLNNPDWQPLYLESTGIPDCIRLPAGRGKEEITSELTSANWDLHNHNTHNGISRRTCSCASRQSIRRKLRCELRHVGRTQKDQQI